MKKLITAFNRLIISISLIEFLIINQGSYAFFPSINEPSKNELKSTSIKMRRTAIQLIQYGQYQEAVKVLELAVKLNPQEENLWLTLSEAQFRLNNIKNSIKSLDKVLALNPKNEAAYFRKGSIYMNSKDLEKAISMFKKVLSLDDKNETVYFQLGNAFLMLKEYKLALNTYEKVTRLNPNFWQVINNQGLILYEINKVEEAISKFKLAVKISNNAEPKLALAISIYSKEGKSIDTLDIAKKALINNPKYAFIEYQSEQLWGKKLKKSAQLLFKTKEMKKAVKEAKENSQ